MVRSALLILVLSAVSLGCVERRLLITSKPAGALVYLNDQEVGRTPLNVPFTWYGVYDVRVEQAGYDTLQTMRKAERPWWETPGPDLFAEAIPNRKVHIKWHLELQPEVPADQIDPEKVLKHAQQLRSLNDRD